MDSWIEVSNVLDRAVDCKLRLYNTAGEQKKELELAISSHETSHLHINDWLGDNEIGVVRIESSVESALIAQAEHYYRNESRGVVSVVSTQSREANAAITYGTYNTYLSMYNWLKVINLTAESREVQLRIGEGNAYRLYLGPYGGLDLPLHDKYFGVPSNVMGVVSIEDREPGKVFSQIIRVKPASTAEYDFVLSTDVE